MHRNWYVLHVKPRTEKKVAAYMRLYRYLHYLPLWTKVRKVQRRKVKTELPFFPGYVFARLDGNERLRVLQTNLLVRTIEVRAPRELIHQLRQIKRAARGMQELKVVNPFRQGDYVRVKSGPLMGTEGHVIREGSQAKLILNVEILNQAVELAISPDDLELCSHA